MNPRIISQGILRALGILFAIALFLYVLYTLSALIGYVVIAAIISLMGRPISFFLQKKIKLSTTVAALLTMTLFVIIISGFFALFIPIISQQSENLSLLNIGDFEEKITFLISEIATKTQWDWRHWLSQQNLTESLNLNALPNFINLILGWLSNFTVGLFSVIFVSFFLLKDAQLLEKVLFVVLDDKTKPRIKSSLEKIKDLLSRYFLGLSLQISILLIIYTIVLLIFGIPNAFIIAFLCALLNLIPYIGPLIGGLLMLVLSLTANIDPNLSRIDFDKSLYVMIGFVVGQLVDNFFSQPFIFSNSVKSHPLEIFLIIMIAGILFGTLGLIFAIPLYTALKVIFKEFYAHNKIVQSLTKDI